LVTKGYSTFAVGLVSGLNGFHRLAFRCLGFVGDLLELIRCLWGAGFEPLAGFRIGQDGFARYRLEFVDLFNLD